MLHMQTTADSIITSGRQTYPSLEVAASARQHHRHTASTHATNQNFWSRRAVTRQEQSSTRRPLEPVTLQI
jgi:hypothetical protein